MLSAVDFIAAAASDFGATAEKTSDRLARLQLPLKLADGRVVPYALVVEATGNEISAREETPDKLPGFCPERHINYDGTFCLYFPGVETMDVVDHESATAWWETLWKFLKLQVRAAALRRWPNGDAWAHGAAALHQKRAQEAAFALKGTFAQALVESRLKVEHRGARRGPAGPTLRLFKDDVHLYSVWENSGKVVNLKQRCFCGTGGRRPKKIRSCEDHAKQAAALVLALRDWEREDECFWTRFKGRPCCGSCDRCPLS